MTAALTPSSFPTVEYIWEMHLSLLWLVNQVPQRALTVAQSLLRYYLCYGEEGVIGVSSRFFVQTGHEMHLVKTIIFSLYQIIVRSNKFMNRAALPEPTRIGNILRK